MITAYFDGACYPKNPNGNMGIGAIVYEDDKVIHTVSKEIKIGQQGYFQTSNNVSEYLALISILEKLIELEYTQEKIDIYGDSQLVIRQMRGDWRVNSGIYAKQALTAIALNKKFKKIRYHWIPREQNELADSLSTAFSYKKY
jgi:ribonuclease HI